MKNIIIGYGEVGKALEKVLSGAITIVEKEGIIRGLADHLNNADIMHICFEYSEKFEEEVKKYQEKYKSHYTIIHSTVPVGTSRKLNAIHSPVIGLHPYLEQSLKIFTKFLSGEQASEVADYFRKAGIKIYLFDAQETTELMKILDTTHYGIEIEYAKEIKRQCNKYNIPFEAWTIWVNNYNEGYKKLDYPEYSKPNLIPIMTKQGGHCTINNCDLLENEFTDFLKKQNEKEKMVSSEKVEKRKKS